MVTVEGQVLQVNETNHADLFWGTRGGCGNFGIVTALELALYPVKEVFGGQVLYSIADGKQVFNAYLEWVKTVPDELTSMLRITHFPPLPEMPEMLRGKSVMSILACYNGPASTAEAVLHPIRTLATALQDTFVSMPYSRIATISNDPLEAPPVLVHSTAASFREILPSDVDTILEIAATPASGIILFEIRHVDGGAYARLSEDTMAFHLNSAFTMLATAIGPTTETLAIGKQSLSVIVQALQSSITGEVLLNLTDAHDLSHEGVRAAFPPASYQRLVALKDQYDSENVLRFNANIPPSSKV
jgi:hypothetical protein